MNSIIPSPKVSIGMPVYNGEKYIRDTLDSLLAQTFTDFELIISDNASTDKTEDICRKYAMSDQRINYIRQIKNKGAQANFRFVLNEAVGQYFMWASDDYWGSDFLEKTSNFLDENIEYVAAITNVTTENNDNQFSAGIDRLDQENALERISAYLKNPKGNCQFHSLMRRKVILSIGLDDPPYLGQDWFIVTQLLYKGKMAYIEGESAFFKRNGVTSGNIISFFDNYRNSNLEYLMPMLKLLTLSVKNYGFNQKIITFLIYHNIRAAISYWIRKIGIIKDKQTPAKYD